MTTRPSARYTSPLDESDFRDVGPPGSVTPESQDAVGWKARSDISPWPIPEPFDWGAGSLDDRNWYAQFHGWRVMDAYLSAYGRTGDARQLRRVVPWMGSWGEYRASVPPDLLRILWPISGMRCCRAAHVVDAYRSGRLELTDQEWDGIYDTVLNDVRWLMEPGNIVLMNHAYFQVMGLGRIGRVLGDDEAFAGATEVARETFGRLVRSQFTEDGVHVENTPSYHDYALGQIYRCGGLVESEPKFVDRARAVLPWLAFPDGRLADFGDNDGSAAPLEDPGPHVMGYAGEQLAVAPTWRSGYVIVRSLPNVPVERSSMLVLAGTSHTHTHSHADKLSFEWWERGRRLIVDTGKYGYTRDAMRDYVIGDAAHNAIGLADEPIPRHRAILGGTSLDEPVVGPDGFALGGETRWALPRTFRHRRAMTYAPGRSLRIVDAVASGEGVRFASRLHFDRALEVRRDGDRRLTADLDDGTLVVELVTEGWELTMHRGETDPHRGWQSVGYLQMAPIWMAEAVCPAETFWPEVEWRLRLE